MTRDEAFKTASQEAMAEGRAITIFELMDEDTFAPTGEFHTCPSSELHYEERNYSPVDEVMPPGVYYRTKVFVSGHNDEDEVEEFYREGCDDAHKVVEEMQSLYPTAKRIHVTFEYTNL